MGMTSHVWCLYDPVSSHQHSIPQEPTMTVQKLIDTLSEDGDYVVLTLVTQS